MSIENTLPFHHLDDDSFRFVLYEQFNGSIHFDVDRLSSLKFNLLLSEVNRKLLTPRNDFDPDTNFYNDSFNCEYYIGDKFSDMLATNR